MSVSRGLVLTALFAMLVGIPSSSYAQHYEAARQMLDLSPDPIARSPRLLGMGSLLLADDMHNKIGMWDFASNPTGILDADSTSTFDLRPSTAASSGRHSPIGFGYERQVIASREVRLGYEAWRRTENGNAYGFIGNFSTLRADQPFSDDSEVRATFNEPSVLGVLGGKIPFMQPERMRYALSAWYSNEKHEDDYLALFANGAGQYLGRDAALLPPPEKFTPTEHRISTVGGTGGLSYRLAAWSTTSVVAGAKSSRVEGANTSVIHDSRTGEDRTTYLIQATEMGGIPKASLEWIYDFRAWTSSSEGRWAFTIKAGLNQDPFLGRGKLQDRDETGLSGRGRLRWVSGKLALAGSIDHGTNSIEITPPPLDDPTSYNHFLNVAANRDGADSLALPDSVAHRKTEETYWGAGGGATWMLRKGLVGIEYHYGERKFIQSLAGEGPKRRVWDVRTGLEYPCTSVLTGRMGYVYRDDDRDLLTADNEYTSHSVTFGMGLSPQGSIWGVDVGFKAEWIRPGFDPMDDPKESRHEMAMQVHWAF